MQARPITVTIAVPLAEAYAFAHQPAHFARWAKGLADTLHHDPARGWLAATPQGEAEVRFTPRNDYGVLDHWVTLPGKLPIFIPLRMVANGDGTEVTLLLLRQPDMDDAAFERDAAAVRGDLAALKALLED